MPRVLASADIGSNTVHMLIAEVEGEQISRIGDLNEWISLGEVVGKQEKIPSSLADRLIRILADFRKAAVAQGAEAIYVFATEAMRKSTNQRQVIDAIRAATGIGVDLISGQREAELGLRGAWLDSKGPGPFLLCEVGGGSAQIAHCSVQEGALPAIEKEVSLPIGTGTLIAQLGLQCPCPESDFQALSDALATTLADGGPYVSKRVVVCGGVARGLWRALHPDGDRQIAREELDYLTWATRQLPLDVIVDRFQVKPKRAATLLPGAVLYRTLLEQTGHDAMTVSRFGVREGAILEMGSGAIPTSRL